MNYLRINIFLLISGMTVLLLSCNNAKKKDGESCEYDSLTEEYRVVKVTKTPYAINRIRFVNTMKPELIRELNQNQIKSDIPEFNDAMMQNTSKVYMITVDIITSGSCTPEIITSIALKN